MRGTALFPVLSDFFAEKGIGISTPDIAAGADLAPCGHHFYHFHGALLFRGLPESLFNYQGGLSLAVDR